VSAKSYGSYLARKSGVSLFGQGIGTVTGLALDATILAFFGVGLDTDALFAALALPAVFTDTLEVQLPKVLVPILLGSAARQGSAAADRLLLSIGVVMTSLFAGLALVGVWCASWLVAIQVPGFSQEAKELTASLVVLLFWLLPFRGLAAILQSGLLARHCYAVPSVTKAVSQIATLSWIILGLGSLTIEDVGVGLLVGAIASIALQTVVFWYQGFSQALPRWNDLVSAWRALRLLPVPLVSQGIGEGTLLLENWLTSFLAPGVLSSLRYGTRIATATGGIIVGSVVRAALPVLSAAVARGNRAEVSSRLEEALKLVLLLGGVIFVFFVFFIHPLVALFLSRGRFGSAETATVSLLALMFIPCVVLGRVLGVIQLPFYANLKMLPTLAGSVVALVAYAIAAPLALSTAGVYGLPLARLAALTAAVVVTYRLARSHFDLQLRWHRIVALPIRISLQFGGACLLGVVTTTILPFGVFDTDLGRLLGPMLVGGIGLLASVTSALGINSAAQVRAMIRPLAAKARQES
jgi:murein biosynthesis integral membrane protein MurJ